MDFSSIFNQVLILFAVLVAGYFLRKGELLDENATDRITTLVVKVTSPLLIVDAMSQPTTLAFSSVGLILLVSAGVYAYLMVMAFILPGMLRVRSRNLGVFRFMTVFGNVGFMGFPVLMAVYGKEAIFIASIFNLPFNVLVYTLGIFFITAGQNKAQPFHWRILVNPGTVAVLAGLVLFGLRIELHPVVSGTVSMLGGLTTPLSMLVLGASMIFVDFRLLLLNFRIYIFSVVRLLVVPALVLVVLSAMGFSGLMLGVPVIITGMPVASMSVMMAREYEGDTALAAEGVFISTAMSLGTIVVLSYLIELAR